MRQGLVEEAERLEESGHFAEAIERWRTIVSEDPSAEYSTELGRLCAEHGDPAEGERLLRQTMLVHPDYEPARFHLAMHLYEHGRIEEAIPLLERSTAEHPLAADLIILGNAYRVVGRHDEGRQCFERAIALEPGHEEAWYGLGLIDSFDGLLDRALESFAEAIRVNPDFASAHRELGQVLWQRDELEAAEEHVRTALRLKGQDAWAHAYLGCILSARERVEEAEAPFRAALEIWPDSTLFHCYLGQVLRKLDRDREAEREFKAALALDTSDYLANLRLGQLRQDHGQLEQARFYIERARHSNPSSPIVKRAIEALERES
jgi:tetratricopeptide (TPR) repeat protein